MRLLVGFNPTSSAFLELYADHDDRPGHTASAFSTRGRIGSSATATMSISTSRPFSLFSFRPNLAAVVSIDRMFDPNPDGDRIPYLPFDPTSESTLLIAGIDSRLHKRFGIIPNVEWVIYGGSGTDRPDDIVPRITFYYSF